MATDIPYHAYQSEADDKYHIIDKRVSFTVAVVDTPEQVEEWVLDRTTPESKKSMFVPSEEVIQ